MLDKVFILIGHWLKGHFRLFSRDREIICVQISTFEEVNPKILIVVIGDTQIIKDALEKRDDRPYDLDQLYAFQENELRHSQLIVTHLKISIMTFDKQKNISDQLISFIHKNLA